MMSRLKMTRLIIILVIIAALILSVKPVLKLLYPFNYSQYIYKYSAEYNLDPYLVAAVIKTESGYKADAKSNKNAYGLMQITRDTSEWIAQKLSMDNFQLDMLYNPQINIMMGCWYLNNLKTEFNDNMDLVLAAYNGGRGNVKKWLKDSEKSHDGVNLHYIPFPETDKYIKRVKVNYKMYKYLYNIKR